MTIGARLFRLEQQVGPAAPRRPCHFYPIFEWNSAVEKSGHYNIGFALRCVGTRRREKDGLDPHAGADDRAEARYPASAPALTDAKGGAGEPSRSSVRPN